MLSIIKIGETEVAWPEFMKADRRGFGQSEYTIHGEIAPVTWHCGCGSWMKPESFDEERKIEFLQEHSNCKPLCFKCHKVEVSFVDGWCEKCEEAANNW